MSLATPTTATVVVTPSRAQRAGEALRKYPVVQVAALLVAFAFGAIAIEGFASSRSITNILISASFLGIAAAGQTLVVLVGGIDLSVASLISSSAILTSYLYGSLGWPDLLVFAFVFVYAGVVGVINGFVAERFGANPLIVTLGMGFIAIGFAQVITGGGSDSLRAPEWLGTLSRPISTTFGLPVPPVVVVWVLLIVVVTILTARASLGRLIYSVGSSPAAARLALVRVRVVWLTVFAISAVFAALVGILLAGYAGSGNTTLGDPYLFLGLAAVIVGGTTMDGRGDYFRTCVAALLLTVVQAILIGFGFTTADRQIVFGLLILIAVAGYIRQPKLRELI